MNWKYYIPHIWEQERQIWEDVYLLPDYGSYNGEALWLTIDALGNPNNLEDESDFDEFEKKLLKKLGDNSYLIDGTEIVVRTEDFSKAELLEWVQLWLQQQGFSVSGLFEASAEDFQGKAFHVDFLAHLKSLN
ncbi:hypothetical protein H6G74_18965 [Nostoc spongiaeforme FACHB-130]|uniref:Uncharacterized protein n=1 Tax=Nostoc spongiaeforme FACHB-130 TaxID=1357510 RepID=A0ABR8FZG1_9NOSO|nr:hypothetical protein [Nostoc spongiaeforme]MBD2596396.1 hypothetical protein [Nostoc spongiaeforme FACHB-130]